MQLMTLNALSAGLLVALAPASLAQESLPRPQEPRVRQSFRTYQNSRAFAFASLAAIVLYLFK